MKIMKKASWFLVATVGLVSCGKGAHNMKPSLVEDADFKATKILAPSEISEADLNLAANSKIETVDNPIDWDAYVNRYGDLKLFWLEASQPGLLTGTGKYATTYGVSTEGWESYFVFYMNSFFMIGTHRDLSEFTISQFGKYHYAMHGKSEGRVVTLSNLDYEKYVSDHRDVYDWFAEMGRINRTGSYAEKYKVDTTGWEARWLAQMNRYFGTSLTDPGQFDMASYGKFHFEYYGIRDRREINVPLLTCKYPGLQTPQDQYYHYIGSNTVHTRIGFANQFGLVGASFSILSKKLGWDSRIDILDGISAAGAGWQFSAIAQTENPTTNRVWVFNQGAGNSDQQWGYRPEVTISNSPLYNVFNKRSVMSTILRSRMDFPITSDHHHPVTGVIPDFATRIQNSPCNDKSPGVQNSQKFFDAQLKVSSFLTNVVGDKTNRDWAPSQITHIKHQTILKPTVSKNWRYFKVEEALYLNKWEAAEHNFRIYLIGPKGGWVKGPIFPHWDQHWMPNLVKDPLEFAGPEYSCGDWLEKGRCQVRTDDISMAILVWQVSDGEQIGLVLHRDNLSNFYAYIGRTLSHRCANAYALLDKNGQASWENLKKYHNCGNLEWHSFIKGRKDLERDFFKTKKGKPISYNLMYGLGTFRELVQFAEDQHNIRLTVTPAGVMSVQKRSIAPAVNPTPAPTATKPPAVTPAAKPTACKSKLLPNEILKVNQKLCSADGRFVLNVQGDGNLVLTRTTDRKVLWHAGKQGNSPYAALQGDGNFVLYHGNVGVWHTATNGMVAKFLALQNDGNLVLYRSDDKALWNTGTFQK